MVRLATSCRRGTKSLSKPSCRLATNRSWGAPFWARARTDEASSERQTPTMRSVAATPPILHHADSLRTRVSSSIFACTCVSNCFLGSVHSLQVLSTDKSFFVRNNAICIYIDTWRCAQTSGGLKGCHFKAARWGPDRLDGPSERPPIDLTRSRTLTFSSARILGTRDNGVSDLLRSPGGVAGSLPPDGREGTDEIYGAAPDETYATCRPLTYGLTRLQNGPLRFVTGLDD